MARKISGGLAGQPSVGAINVAPTAVLTTATDTDISFGNNAILNSQNDLRFGDADNSNWVALQAPETIASNVTWTLPSADGTSNQVLSTNGTGTLSWETPAISLSDNSSDAAANYLAFTTATSGSISAARVSSSKLTFQPSTATLTSEGPVVHRRPENIQVSSYTLALSDRNIVVTMNNSGAATVTVPTDAAVDFPIGADVHISRVGAGAVTLAASGGVTLSKTGTFGANEEITVRKRSANNWIVIDAERKLTGSGGTTSTPTGFSLHQFTSTGAATFTVS